MKQPNTVEPLWHSTHAQSDSITFFCPRRSDNRFNLTRRRKRVKLNREQKAQLLSFILYTLSHFRAFLLVVCDRIRANLHTPFHNLNLLTVWLDFSLDHEKPANPRQMQVTHSDLLSQKNGLFMAMLFSSCRVSVSVALNSSVWRLAGRISKITSRSLVKSVQPCSSSRSASSKICHRRKGDTRTVTKTRRYYINHRYWPSNCRSTG